MYLSPTEIEKIAKAVLKQLDKSGIKVKDAEKAKTVVTNIINESMAEERRIEEDALKLLKKHQQAAGASLDHDRALRMIKEKLATERKFIL